MIKSQFSYCPLVWMFCSRQSNNLIKKIHERSLRISYKDQKISYQNLLETHNELTIHQRNLQVFVTEIYKIVNGVAPPIMNSLFEFLSNKYNIRNFQVLSTDFNSLFNKVAGLRPATLLKKRLCRTCFPANFVKFLRTPFLTEHLRRLLLFRRTVKYGIETIKYRAPSLLEKLPSEYKLVVFLKEFKVRIKKWKCDTCPCRLCKKFQPNLGFAH